jgi:glycosyltransferase involved in cell wall biosynthesis
VKLRVLHCIYDDPGNPWVGGGGSLRVRELYRRLAADLDVTVATGSFPGGRDETDEGIRYVRLGSAASYPLSRLTFGVRATALLRSGHYDVGLFDFSVYTPIRLPRVPNLGLVVHMLHGPSAAERWGRIAGGAIAALERAMIRRARRICATSRVLRDRLQALVPEARIDVVRSGVPDEFFQVGRREAEYLLCYGRFDVFQKGIDTALDAFSRLAAMHPGLRLRIAGRGKDAGLVDRLVLGSGLSDRVTIERNPSRAAVLELMSGARLMVAPSRVEGLPMALAEAMAAGVPVIASDVGAVAEVLQLPAGGSVIPPDDAAALAAAADRFLRDDELRARTSESARLAARRFSWERVADEHHEFLKRLATPWGAESNLNRAR